MYKRNFMLTLLVLGLTIILASCDSTDSGTKYLEDRLYESLTTKDDCYLCGINPDSSLSAYWGESNIGLLNLNTFECSRFEINRYDSNQSLIDKKGRYGHSIINTGSTNGSSIYYSMNRDRGFMSGSITLRDKSVLEMSEISDFLCSECLSGVINQYLYDESHWDIAVVDFAAKTIRPLERNSVGFQCSDYYISCEYDERYEKIDFQAFYCPVRYTELDYDENEGVQAQIENYCARYEIDIAWNDELLDFIGEFTKISEVSSYGNGEIVSFMEWDRGMKQLTVNKDGSYHISDY